MAIGLLEETERPKQITSFSSLRHNSAEYIHTLIDVFRIAFLDACWWAADLDKLSNRLPEATFGLMRW